MDSGAIRDAGGISIPVTVDPSTMKPGFEEVKRIIARSPNVIKIKPEMDFQEGQITRAMNKAIREAERASAKLAADVRLINEKSFVFEPRIKFSPEAVKVRVAEMVRTAQEQAARQQIEVAAKIRYVEDSRIVGPQTRSISERNQRIVSRTPEQQAVRDRQAQIIVAMRNSGREAMIDEQAREGLFGKPDMVAVGRSSERTLKPIRNLDDALARLGGSATEAAAKIAGAVGIVRAMGTIANVGDNFSSAIFGSGTQRAKAAESLGSELRGYDDKLTGGVVQRVNAGGFGSFTGRTFAALTLANKFGRLISPVVSRILGTQTQGESENFDRQMVDVEAKIKAAEGKNQRLVVANQSAQSIVSSGRAELTARGKTPAEIALDQARSAAAAYEKTLTPELKRSADVQDAQKVLNEKIIAAEKDVANERAAIARSNAREISSIRAEASQAYLRAQGHDLQAEREALQATLQSEVQATIDAITQMRSEGQSPAVIAAATAKLNAQIEAGKVRMQALAVAQAREGGEFVTESGFRVSQSKLRQSQKTDQEELAQVKHESESRLDEVGRKFGVFGPDGDYTPQYKAAVQEGQQNINETMARQKRRQEADIAQAKSDANVATLRANKQFYEADLQAFDDAAKAKMKAIRGESQEYQDAVKKKLAAERQLIVESHGDQQIDIKASYDTRKLIAKELGAGQDRAAGVTSRLSEMGQELRVVSPEHRDELIATQKEELKGMQDRILKPHSGGRAIEVDARNMAISDPFSDRGREDRSIQEQIREYLRQIADKIGNSVARVG